jgi:hypothetical protein
MRLLVQQSAPVRATAKAFALPVRHLREAVNLGELATFGTGRGRVSVLIWEDVLATEQPTFVGGLRRAKSRHPAARPISDLGRETPAHADTRFNLVPGFLIEPDDGRVGLDDLQIDLDAAESR